MPEIAEVARIAHILRTHVAGRTIARVHVQDDPIVYNKVVGEAAGFAKSLTGKKVVDVRTQGKYFWLELSSPPHALMHFGMTGWIFMNNMWTPYWPPQTKGEGATAKDGVWPPEKYWKFRIEMEGEEKIEFAFVDPRRLGRIRLVDAPGNKMRKTAPLKDNGPDPVLDGDFLTKAYLHAKLQKKKVPVKAFLLDQSNISGVGNWVGDEILFQARIHPEQYTNTLSVAEAGKLHDALMLVCKTACDAMAEKDQFPDNWLFKLGRKNKSLPTGEKIVHIKVGGRTSAVVPSLQRKTGATAGDVSDESDDFDAKSKVKAEKKKPVSKRKQADDDEDIKPAKRGKATKVAVKVESGNRRTSLRVRDAV